MPRTRWASPLALPLPTPGTRLCLVRSSVPLAKASRLLNHGPVTLITSAHAGRRNVMAASWVMPLDFDPPKLTAVIDGTTYTRELVDASRELVVHVPTRGQVAWVDAVGTVSGRDVDKFEAHALATLSSAFVGAPSLVGCAAWLECRVLPAHEVERAHDLFVLEVVAAFADSRCFVDGRYVEGPPDLSSLHHAGGGTYFATGGVVHRRG